MANAVTAATRVSIATMVAVVSPRTRGGVVETLSALSESGVRPVFICLDGGGNARPIDRGGLTIIEALKPRYLDNAVASLRLSSLPTVAWWRADEPDVLDQLAPLVDRVVLDVDEPSAVWRLVPSLGSRTAVSDMRWARLTRWRDLLAQFFEIPEVRAEAGQFDRLELHGTDRHQMRLLGGWLSARLPAGDRLTVAIETGRAASIEAVRLFAAGGTLDVRVLAGRACLETSAQMGTGHSAVRVVPAGDDRPLTLLVEELRVRSRDMAFEDAVRAAENL